MADDTWNDLPTYIFNSVNSRKKFTCLAFLSIITIINFIKYLISDIFLTINLNFVSVWSVYSIIYYKSVSIFPETTFFSCGQLYLELLCFEDWLYETNVTKIKLLLATQNKVCQVGITFFAEISVHSLWPSNNIFSFLLSHYKC